MSTADTIQAARERLRAVQAAAVMPLIGPLLDAWDGVPNDVKGAVREEAPDLATSLNAICGAMEEQPAAVDWWASVQSAAPASAATPYGWSIVKEGDELLVVGLMGGPGGTYVANKGKLHQRLLFALASALTSPAEPCRPDIEEKLTYHALERDDLKLDEALEALATGWKKVPGRTERQLLLQLVALLAAQPAAHHAESIAEPHGTEMVEVAKEDANNYCRVIAELGLEESESDPVAVIQMLKSWEADAQAHAELLEKHLRNVLEVARTWQPDYATKMDRDTLELAAAAAAAYALAAADDVHPYSQGDGGFATTPPEMWPPDWQWKHADPRRMLTKAGALILAEIERLDRAAARGAKP